MARLPLLICMLGEAVLQVVLSGYIVGLCFAAYLRQDELLAGFSDTKSLSASSPQVKIVATAMALGEK